MPVREEKPSAAESFEAFLALLIAVLLPVLGLARGYHRPWMLVWLAAGVVALALWARARRP